MDTQEKHILKNVNKEFSNKQIQKQQSKQGINFDQKQTKNIIQETTEDVNDGKTIRNENDKWQKLIDQNQQVQKQQEKVPFLLTQKSFQNQNQQLEFSRQKLLMEQTARNGKLFLIEKKYDLAAKQLSKSLMAFEFIMKNHLNHIPKQTIKQIMIYTILPAYNNLTLCHLKLRNYQLALQFANQILAQDHDNIKARYRRGLANRQLKNTDQAIKDFQIVKKLDQQMEKDCDQNIRQCRHIQIEEKKRRKLAAQRFLSGYQRQDTQISKDETQLKNRINHKPQNPVEKKPSIVQWIIKKLTSCPNIFKKLNFKQEKVLKAQ